MLPCGGFGADCRKKWADFQRYGCQPIRQRLAGRLLLDLSEKGIYSSYTPGLRLFWRVGVSVGRGVISSLGIILVRLLAAGRVFAFRVPLKHLPTAGGNWAKFAPGANPHFTIWRALLSFGTKPVANSATSYKLIVNVGRVIGTKGQTRIKIIFDRFGKIWTSYPVK